MPRIYLWKSLCKAAFTGALSTGIKADTHSGARNATAIAALAPLCQLLGFKDTVDKGSIHGMPDQDTFVQFLLFDEFLYILRHDAVILLRGMERMAMVT